MTAIDTAPPVIATPVSAPFRLGVYLKSELLRTKRNKRRLFFTLVFPTLMYLVLFHSGGTPPGITIAAFYMVSMATYGIMNGLLASGAVIALERASGWNRQLRLTGLTGLQYVLGKTAVAYIGALPGLALVFVLGASTGNVSMSGGKWVEVAVSILLATLPLAPLGVLVGYLARPEVVQPLLGIGGALLAIIGGIWFPITHGGLQVIAQILPPYWAVTAGRDVILGSWVGWDGVIAIAGWTVVLTLAAGLAYRKDTLRA